VSYGELQNTGLKWGAACLPVAGGLRT